MPCLTPSPRVGGGACGRNNQPKTSNGNHSRVLKRLICKIRYGKPVIIVSGLPRSGTSMMMKMLEAGGLEVMIDGERTADEDNPQGYYELERVKDLDKQGLDKAWLSGGRGKVVKIISFLLRDLPPANNYKIVFMERDLPEVLASQQKMLVRRGESTGGADPEEDAKMTENYKGHLRRVKWFLSHSPNVEYMFAPYRQVVENPGEIAVRLNEFFGGTLDVAKMTEVPSQKLYRNRAEK